MAGGQRQTNASRALIKGRNFRSEEGVDRTLLAKQRDVLAAEKGDFIASSLFGLHPGGDMQQKPDLP